MNKTERQTLITYIDIADWLVSCVESDVRNEKVEDFAHDVRMELEKLLQLVKKSK